MEISIDPKQPRSLPDMKLLGSNEDVLLFKQKISQNIETWDASYSVVENLERIMEIEFPLPTSSQRQVPQDHIPSFSCAKDVVLLCLICLEYEEEGWVPDQVCERCRNSYHHSCLEKAFLAKKKARARQISFGYRIGQCPHCNAEMKMKI